MKALVIGSGGREHAIAWALSNSPEIEEVLCVPGNGGTAVENKCRNLDIPLKDLRAAADAAVQELGGTEGVVAVIGPENPLTEGAADILGTKGIPVVGPTKAAAQLEASKDAAKKFMKKYGVACAASETYTDLDSALKAVNASSGPVVVKADGLAAGKGVVVAGDKKTAEEAVRRFMVDGELGEAGKKLVIEEYLEGEEISLAELNKAIRAATISKKVTPMLCGSSYKNKGVQNLLDAMVEYLPSPLDIDAIKGINPDTGKEESREASVNAPFAGLAFKIATDPFVGGLTFFRVYSGILKAGSYVYNSITGKTERVGRLIRMHANNRTEIQEVGAGDIAAIVGLKDTITGHTLCDEKHPIQLESMNFPEPVIQLAIEPKTKDMQEKMALALGKLSREDPSFRVSTNNETGQTLIAGMGELHLEIIVDRLLREFKVEANVGQPQVSYRETITKPVKAEGKYIRQSGGKGQYGHCLIEMEPLERGTGYEFVDKTVGGSIPKEYIQPINNGIKEAKMCGVLAGYETVDFRVTVYDGSFHEVDSSEMAFKIAGSMAFKDGANKAGPVLLEPIMKVTVEVPDEYLGTVMGNLTSRRGILLGNDTIPGVQRINAEVPLAEMFGYATDLRSQTQGRGTFVMEPLKYQEVPKSITDKIVGERAKK